MLQKIYISINSNGLDQWCQFLNITEYLMKAREQVTAYSHQQKTSDIQSAVHGVGMNIKSNVITDGEGRNF